MNRNYFFKIQNESRIDNSRKFENRTYPNRDKVNFGATRKEAAARQSSHRIQFCSTCLAHCCCFLHRNEITPVQMLSGWSSNIRVEQRKTIVPPSLLMLIT